MTTQVRNSELVNLLKADFVPWSYLRVTHVRASSDSGQSIPHNTETIVRYEDEVYDTLNEYNPGTGVFTATQAGYYHVHASIMFQATTAWAPTEAAILSVFRNGVVYARLFRDTDHTSNNILVYVSGGTTVLLSAGDTLDIRVIQTSGETLALYPNRFYNYLTIDRLI